MTLRDAHNRVWPLPLELIDSSEVCPYTHTDCPRSGLRAVQALEAVLEVKFRQVPGHQKIKRREYALRALHMSADIERSVSFTSHCLPARPVDMTMVFEGGPKYSYPGCKLETSRADDNQIQWYCMIQLYDSACSRVLVLAVRPDTNELWSSEDLARTVIQWKCRTCRLFNPR